MLRYSIAVALAALIVPSVSHAENSPGVTGTEIKIGQPAPFSGPASGYGAISKVMAAYFHMINDQGGINGRKINWIAVDDAFSPPKTVEQVRKLVENDNVLFVHTIGSPTTAAVQRYLNINKIPDIFISSGASRWADKDSPWTMGLNVTYKTEGTAYAQYVLSEKPKAKVAILYQNDDFGRDVLAGFKVGLGDKAKDMIVAEKSYDLSDPTISSQLVTLKVSGADVFLDLTQPRFAAIAIRSLSEIGWKPLHILANVSASVGAVLAPAGVEKSIGIISSSYLKDPNDTQWANDPGMLEWRAFMKKYYPEGKEDSFNIGSYTAAQAIVYVLKAAGNDLSRENIMRQASNMENVELPAMLPGIGLNTTPDDRRPLKKLRLMRFDGTNWVPFGGLYGD